MAVRAGAYSQSGYPVLTDYGASELVVNPEIPGTGGVKVYGGVAKGDVLVICLYVLSRIHKEVEKLQQVLGVWGFNPRKIAGSNTWSNHASGTAWDGNSARHPQGKKNTFTAAQVKSIRAIYASVLTAAGWGGEWTGASVDEMHGQLNNMVTLTGAVKKVADAIRAGQLPNVPKELLSGSAPVKDNPVVKPAPDTKPEVPGNTYVVKKGDTLGSIAQRLLGDASRYPEIAKLNKIKDANVIHVGQRLTIPSSTAKQPSPPKFPLPDGYYYGPLEGPARSISGSYKTDTAEMRKGLATWQQRMKDRGWIIKVDGYYGPQTGNCARQFQKQVKLPVDGLIGINTWKKAWTAPIT